MNRVRARRKELGISLDELARRSGVSKSNLWEIETNDRSPRMDVANRIASALETDLNELFAVKTA